MTPTTDALDTDDPNDADDTAAYPYYFHNSKINKNNMTPNTDAQNDDAPDFAYADATSPDSLILDYSLKRKTEPKSMLKLKKIKTIITDADAFTDDASPNAINVGIYCQFITD